jgi:CheY-like chemotaxis protein
MLALSVDDEKINLVIIEEMAKALDLDIISFSDPREALDFINKEIHDLIFLDISCPSRRHNALREIRKYYLYKTFRSS